MARDELADRDRLGGQFFNDSSRDPPETLSSFNTEARSTSSAREYHESRSERSQTMDEKYNAPITLNYEAWRENPNRLDIPGVDTIPYSEEQRRGREFGERATEAGVVSKVKEDGRLGRSKMGVYKGMSREVWLNPQVVDNPDIDPRFREGPVIAHEVGHGIDSKLGYTSMLDLERDPETKEQVRRVSRMMRGEWSDASSTRQKYRNLPGELVADFFASYATQPRATRREAPDVVEYFEERLPF